MIRENKDDFYNILKNITLEDLALIFQNPEKDKGSDSTEIIENQEKKILYTVNELIEKYPFFTRYNINMAIKKGGLPFCFIGNKRMFSKEEIDKWLEKEAKQKKVKEHYDI